MSKPEPNPPGMPLLRIKTTVTSQTDGRREPAYYMACTDCGNNTFSVFKIVGQEHDHLYCDKCGACYCWNGRCE